MTTADRITHVCRTILSAGPVGDKERGDLYRRFVSCGFDPAIKGATDIGATRTSCGVFVRAVLHWAGRRATRPARAGQPIWDGWLEGLNPWHPAYVKNTGTHVRPSPGCVFARDYSHATTGLYHVGVFIEEIAPDIWITAEGGGGDGTQCRMSAPEGKNIRQTDGMGRLWLGWWRPEKLAAGDSFTNGWEALEAEALGEEPDVSAPVAHRPTLRIRSGYDGRHMAEVRLVQQTTGATPIDGLFGPKTEAAVRAWQKRHHLVADGIVGPKTWAKIDAAMAAGVQP